MLTGTHPRLNPTFNKHQQRGAVSVIMVALAGLGVLGLTAAGLQSIKSSQEQQLAVHTNTQAAARAWSGVELIQAYLAALDASQLAALSTGALTLNGLTDITARVVSNTETSGTREITVNVTGRSVGTTSTVQAVFESTSGSSGGTAPHVTVDTVNINSNLRLTGSINVIGAANANLSVRGTVDLRGSVSGINRICATDDISISSAIEVQRVCTLGDLTMSGGARVVQDAEVVGDVSMSGNTSITTINSNGNVGLSGGSATASTVNTQGNVSLTGGNARIENTVNAEGNILWESGAPAATLNANGNVTYHGTNKPTTINARGNVTLNGNGNVQTLNAMGNVTLRSNWGNGVQGSMRVGGNLDYQNAQVIRDGIVKGSLSRSPNTNAWEPVQVITQNSALSLSVPEVIVPTLNPEIKAAATVDVFQLKDSANYVFEVVGGKRKVTVRNVSGIADGTYFIGDYDYNWAVPALARGNKDYLCEAVNNSGKCTAPTLPYRTLCQGFSESNGCFSYNSSQNKWTLSAQSIAPGVAWFDGNLQLQNGVYLNTFLSTGDIGTGGSLKVFSPNYAGYTPVCTDARTAAPYSLTVDHRLTGLAPTDLCQGGAYVPAPLANVALMAGGYDASGTYVGGDIEVGASNEIYGSVVAGNLLDTSGSSKIVGAVQVARLRADSASSETRWSGSTTIDLSNLPSTFSPIQVPCMTNPAGAGCTAPGGAGGIQIRWTRYI